jgi:long-chain acyl-CoA synthetase
MRHAGVRKGDRVVFLGRNRPEHFEVIFAASKIGAIGVGMNWRLGAAELAGQLADCEPVMVFSTSEAKPIVEVASAELKRKPRIIAFESHGADGYEAFIANGDPAPLPTASAPDDLCMIWYTSGTTGSSKGVTFTHASLWSIFPGCGDEWRVSAESTSLVCMPTFHTAGVGWGLLTFAHGGHAIIVDEFVPEAIVDLMLSAGITNSVFAPIMLEQVTAELERRGRPQVPLRAVVYGASPITEPVLARAVETLRCELIQGYGLTEVNGTISILRGADHALEGPARERLRSAGVAVPWGAIKVVDPESGEDLPPNTVGEVWGKSPGMMAGYWHKPAETAAVLNADGWLRTGDAGFIDADGYLFLTDRIKDMIISGGENIFPIEVEHVIAAHPAVSEVAVIGIPDAKWGETVKAMITLKPGASVTDREIIAFTRERLAAYKCPTSVDFIPEMPRNASGKILKRVLREPFWAGRERRIG